MNDSIDLRKLRTSSFAKGKEPPAPKKFSNLSSILSKDIQLFEGGLSLHVKEGFYLELGTLLESGIDIKTSLELIKEEQNKKKNALIFDKITKDVVVGAMLSVALKNCGQFTAYEYYSIQIGEETGELIVVLKGLAEYYLKRIKQRRQIIGALTYPVLVFTVAFGAVFFMLNYVVPMFADVLKRFGGDLPAITKLVLRLSSVVKHTFLPGCIVLISLLVFIGSQKRSLWFRKLNSEITIRIPLFGPIFKKIYLARFANSITLLIGAKIPIIQAIQYVKQMINFYPIESSLSIIEDNVLSGMPLHRAMQEHSIFPSKMVSLVKVGEEVNNLELFFRKIAEEYSNEVEHQTDLLGKFLEPLIIVFLGGIVGIILIAMYLPLFKLGQSF